MNEYRKLDDAISMRMNRTTAQFRDRDREGSAGKGSVQEQACEYLWRDLVGMLIMIEGTAEVLNCGRELEAERGHHRILRRCRG